MDGPRDVYLVDQDGQPLAATSEDTPELETRRPLDANGDPIPNRYPLGQQWLDPGTGQPQPAPVPSFQPPPTRRAGSG